MTIQLSDTETVAQLWAALVSGRVGYATWAELAVVTSRPIGALAQTDASDVGTHIDPVTALSVDNAGVYRRTVLGWTRIADIEEQVMIDIAALTAQVEALQEDFNEFDPLPGPAEFAKLSFPSAGHRLIVDGSSKPQVGGNGSSMSYIMWMLARWPMRIKYDYTKDNLAISGGRAGTEAALGNNWNTVQYPTGMNHPTRIAQRDARLAAGGDVILLDIGTNDVPDQTDDQWIFNQVKTYHTSARVAGCKLLVLLSLDPRGSASADVQKIIASHNLALEEYANQNADVLFVNFASIMLIADNSGYLPAVNVLSDGVHEPAPTNYRKAKPLYEQAFSKIAPLQELGDFGAEVWDAAKGRRNNRLVNGGFSGTGGTNNFAASGTTTSGTVPDGWEAVGGGAGLTLAWAAEADWTAGNTRFGRTDLKMKPLNLSGSTAADSNFFIRQNHLMSTLGLAVGDKLLPRLCVELTGVTGLQSIGITITCNVGSGILAAWGRAGNYLAVNVLPQLDGTYLFQFPDEIVIPAGATEIGFRVECLHRAAQVVGGQIGLVSAFLGKLGTLP